MTRFIALIFLLIPLWSNLQASETEQKRYAWESGEYRDKFGDLSGIMFSTNTVVFHGAFNNSVTRNEKLFVKAYFDKNGSLGLMLFEGSLSVGGEKRYFADKKYILSIKDSSGRIHDFEGFPSSSEIRFPGGGKSELGKDIVQIFSDGKPLKLYIQGNRRNVESYSFSISAADLNGFYIKLKSIGYKP